MRAIREKHEITEAFRLSRFIQNQNGKSKEYTPEVDVADGDFRRERLPRAGGLNLAAVCDTASGEGDPGLPVLGLSRGLSSWPDWGRDKGGRMSGFIPRARMRRRCKSVPHLLTSSSLISMSIPKAHTVDLVSGLLPNSQKLWRLGCRGTGLILRTGLFWWHTGREAFLISGYSQVPHTFC